MLQNTLVAFTAMLNGRTCSEAMVIRPSVAVQEGGNVLVSEAASRLDRAPHEAHADSPSIATTTRLA